MSTYQELECKLETAEEELQDARAELRALEQRLMSTEIEKASLESGMAKLRTLLSSQEDSLQRCQSERAELAEIGGELRIELQKLRSENEILQMSLLSSRQEHEQVGLPYIFFKRDFIIIIFFFYTNSSKFFERLGNIAYFYLF